MRYYLIQSGQILSGPHDIMSAEVRRLTACGNPDILAATQPEALTAAGLVPENREPLGPGQGWGSAVLAEDGASVLVPAVDLPPAPPVVPAEVTMRQARLALHAAGLLASVEAAIDALPDPPRSAARIEWDHSQTVQRNRGIVQQLGTALGMTSEQLDALFIAAAAIP